MASRAKWGRVSGPLERPGGDVSGLMDRHLGPVGAYVRRRVADQADAEEVVADVFVRAWQRPDAHPKEHNAERAWLLAIARNRVIDQYRRDDARGRMRDRLKGQPLRLVEDAPELPGDPVLGRAMAELSVEDRELLRLVAWEQLSHSDIAVVLGCTTANVSVRLHRARARLRAALRRLEDCESATTSLMTGSEGTSA